jgi:hypothetical protein
MSTTVMKNAGDELDRIAQQLRETEGINSYATGFRLAAGRNPELLRRYNTGQTGPVKSRITNRPSLIARCLRSKKIQIESAI